MSFPRDVFTVFLAAVPFLAMTGCQERHEVRTAAGAAVAHASVPDDAGTRAAIRTIQHSPPYREAQRRFAQRDYRSALDALDQLAAAPQITPADQAFLDRQRVICQSALSRKHSNVQFVPVTVATACPQRTSRTDSADCGPRALLLACRQMDVPATLQELTRAAGTTPQGTTLAGLARAAKRHGLKASGVQMDLPALANLSSPAIAWMDGSHYVAVLRVNGDTATIHDPNKPGKEDLPLRDLLGRSGGILLTLQREQQHGQHHRKQQRRA